LKPVTPESFTPPSLDGKDARYPRSGDRCDICHKRLRGQTLSLVAVQERLMPDGAGEPDYDGPWFWPLVYFCTPHCARAAPQVLESAGIAMTSPAESLVTRCARCGTLTDRTQLVTNLVLDQVQVGGTDDDVTTLFDFATLCRPCAEELELFVDEELDEDDYDGEPVEFESLGAPYE